MQDKENEILIFSELMDSQSLFLTANADTVYFVGIVDLTSGPMVVETPPQALALFDDMWFQWIVDFGLPGPDRGEGGPFLLIHLATTAPCPTAATTSATRARPRRSCSAVVHQREPRQDPAPTVEVSSWGTWPRSG